MRVSSLEVGSLVTGDKLEYESRDRNMSYNRGDPCLSSVGKQRDRQTNDGEVVTRHTPKLQ